MKLVTYDQAGEPRAGIIDNDLVFEAGSIFHPVPGDVIGPLSNITLMAPVPKPEKIVCVGLNYRDHAAESGQEIPKTPILFAKFPNAIVGPGAAIQIPPITEQVDYEAELGVVIGKTARAVKVDEALDYVLGYTCVNDVSARDLQFPDGQWVRGKTLDTFCPIGPWIVTVDEITDPQTLGIRCVVNGAVLQDSSTAQMVFGVAELVSFISQGITLEPGDIIATGTPPGVGFARRPPIWLQPGDIVRIEIDGIGILENPVTDRGD